jgi:hypothetical protein
MKQTGSGWINFNLTLNIQILYSSDLLFSHAAGNPLKGSLIHVAGRNIPYIFQGNKLVGFYKNG